MNVLETARPDIAKYRVLEKPAEDYTPADDQALSSTAKLHQLHPFLVYFKKERENCDKTNKSIKYFD